MYSKKKKKFNANVEKVQSQCVPYGFISSTYAKELKKNRDCSGRGMLLSTETATYNWVSADASCVFCFSFFNVFFFIHELARNSIGFVHLEARIEMEQEGP